jgi:Protein of unknown function (DUF3015)
MKTLKLAVLASLVLAASTASAQGIKGNGRYGTAGCGLGSLVFADQPGLVQIFAATTNATGIQTFGITTGTSNCGPGLVAQGTKNFVEANRVALAKDAARGQGDAIGAVAVINHCDNIPAVAAALQRDFKVIFPSEQATDVQVTNALLKTLHGDPATGCKAG